MNLQPEIEDLAPKALIGINRDMSLNDDETGLLWRDFMTQFKSKNGDQQHDFYSVQIYSENYFYSFAPDKAFTKWAAVEQADNIKPVDGFQEFGLPGGLYAIFRYKGSSLDKRIFQYIYTQWLPNSGYQLDDRPHFELLGEKYKNNDPTSEELIFIPIKKEKMANIDSQIETYKALIERTPDVELKGKNMLYTSVNGYMFSQINKAGEIGIRLPKDQAASFIELHNSGPFKSYGATMKDYVLVPSSVLSDKKLASSYLHKSYLYTKSLPPK